MCIMESYRSYASTDKPHKIVALVTLPHLNHIGNEMRKNFLVNETHFESQLKIDVEITNCRTPKWKSLYALEALKNACTPYELLHFVMIQLVDK